jgi:hypothetical protein
MTTSTKDDSQRTAARVAGISCLFTMAIVVFANYSLFDSSLQHWLSLVLLDHAA